MSERIIRGLRYHLCTAKDPWTGRDGQPERAIHPDARITGGCDFGCCDDYTCPHCGHTWRVEQPD